MAATARPRRMPFAGYRAILAVPGSAGLFASALIARLPQGMSSLAILLLVRGSTHSYAAAGAAVGADAFAVAACAPVAGRLVDRYGRARVLAPFALGQACAYVGLVVAARAGAGAAAQIALAALAGALLPPIAPVVRVLLRRAFDDPITRDTAYALESVLQELVWMTGPLVVAVVIAIVSPSAAVVLLGAIGVLGTLTFLRGRLIKHAGSQPALPRHGSALASAELRALLIPVALTGAALGATEVGLPSLALHAGSRPAAGLLLALWSVGSMTGGLWYGGRTWRAPLGARYRVLLIALIACTAPLIAARSILVGAIFSLLVGLPVAPMFSCQYALVGRTAPPGAETEAFTWMSAALVGGIAAGSALGGAAIGLSGVSGPFVLACGVALLAALIAAGFRGRLEPQPA